ncbi:hypothetical protein M408DRAFT_333895 [Serendipita vermifera MAFF 305830]|uniref:Uncharacterized protein n=1 Tax=Serendipita vermifera MAFF 305830 TaxID=933852 RepID=A0A0C3A7M5_SERVB|nr:hypothetical protein M408DRAFT_333895 [Serendipita vermifera MAFF 305830]
MDSPIDNGPIRRPPERKRTQADQDKEDDKARKKAQEQLVQSWMDRLQLISVITTFFAANEAQLLGITTPSVDPESTDKILQTSNAMLASSLVLHSFSAVIAFIGAFVLVTYKLKEEKREELDNHEADGPMSRYRDKDGIYGVGSLRRSSPPTELLKAAHSIAVATAFVGFIFVVIGIICYIWAQQPRSVSIFSSATLLICILVSLTVVNPLQRAEKLIYQKS